MGNRYQARTQQMNNKEQRGIYNVAFNAKKATALRTDLETIEYGLAKYLNEKAILFSKGYHNIFNVGERKIALTYKDTQIRGFDKVSGKTRKDKIYLTSRDGFSFVAMGFTGTKALEWKISFIDAFNYMENELRAIKDNATATLEQPKEVFNLIYETPCREAVLRAVKNIERDKKAKVHSIKEYTITEKMKHNKVITDCKIGVQWDTPPLLNAKEVQALNQRKRKCQ